MNIGRIIPKYNYTTAGTNVRCFFTNEQISYTWKKIWKLYRAQESCIIIYRFIDPILIVQYVYGAHGVIIGITFTLLKITSYYNSSRHISLKIYKTIQK